jgi:hypothetical protein
MVHDSGSTQAEVFPSAWALCLCTTHRDTTCFNVPGPSWSTVNASGSLCFVATILACTCGLWNSKKNCALYWAYEDMVEMKFNWQFQAVSLNFVVVLSCRFVVSRASAPTTVLRQQTVPPHSWTLGNLRFVMRLGHQTECHTDHYAYNNI